MSIDGVRRAIPWLLALALFTSPARTKDLIEPQLSLVGDPEIVFDMSRASCTPPDVIPDINPRAFRDNKGKIVFFALHSVNRAFHGPDLSHLVLDCHVVLDSGNDPDPSHYNDRNFITATWTTNGSAVAALIHHEYHADDFGRCRVKDVLGCWYNTILAYHSSDGGKTFLRSQPLVVAAAPFTQDIGQGRHRGFFNPSNIFSDGRYEYFFAATTGWDGQPFGACLFRSVTPLDSASWRAFDGRAFSIHYEDPYRHAAISVEPCARIEPFTFPVGGVVRDRKHDIWIAVFEATHNESLFPVDGIYYATARDLFHWSLPRLLRAGPTISSDLCAMNNVVAYPSILADDATGRNFDNFENEPFLYFTVIATKDCQAGKRLLMRQRLAVTTEGLRR